MGKAMHVYAEVELDDLIGEFSEEDILKALRAYRGLEAGHTFAVAINVVKVMPALIADLRATQASREKDKAWNDANALCELCDSIEAAWRRYK